MSDRQKGCYWVSYASPHVESGIHWTVAEYVGGTYCWEVPGMELSWEDGDLLEIGAMVEAPANIKLEWAK